MKIAVIGAGFEGLTALKYCIDSKYEKYKINVVCYEKSDQVGGTWVYVPETGNDHYGLPIHSSMYNDLL